MMAREEGIEKEKKDCNSLRKFMTLCLNMLSLFLKFTEIVVHTLILYEMEVISVLNIMLLLSVRTKI